MNGSRVNSGVGQFERVTEEKTQLRKISASPLEQQFTNAQSAAVIPRFC